MENSIEKKSGTFGWRCSECETEELSSVPLEKVPSHCPKCGAPIGFRIIKIHIEVSKREKAEWRSLICWEKRSKEGAMILAGKF